VVTAAESRGVHLSIAEEAEMSEDSTVDRQFVGMDLHRRRSVLVRMNQDGERLETVRIVNHVDRLAAVIARAGESARPSTWHIRWASRRSPTGG